MNLSVWFSDGLGWRNVGKWNPMPSGYVLMIDSAGIEFYASENKGDRQLDEMLPNNWMAAALK